MEAAAECRKNPGHVQFIPTASFLPTSLPERFCSQLVWSLIYHKAWLTVRLIVNFVSPDRPVEFQEGNCVRNTGTGYVTQVDRTNPHEVTITIDTAAHVVFDHAEAESAVAKFYFWYNREVFQLRHARLVDQNSRKDVSRIMFTVDLETVQRLANEFAVLEYALSPSVIFDVNNNINISLLKSVVVRYRILSFSCLSFLFTEIKCLKNIMFLSNVTRSLQLEINISLTLLYDVILLIMAVTSNRDHLMGLMEDIGGWNVINIKRVQRPYITFRKEIEINNGNNDISTSKLPLSWFLEMDQHPMIMINEDFIIIQKERLHRLMTYFIRSPIEEVALNEALTDFCQFDISARYKKSDRIVIEIPVTSESVRNRMSLEVNLHDVRLEEEEHDDIAVLVSHPHDMLQQITIGKLETSRPRRITYSTPSCPGSSGGSVYVMSKEPKSLNDLENIDVYTHSHVSLVSERGVGSRF